MGPGCTARAHASIAWLEVACPGPGLLEALAAILIWEWVKIKPTGDSRFWSMFPFAKNPFWVPIFDPQPYASV